MKSHKKLVLAIDMDDVIADSMSLILSLYNKEYGMHLTKKDLLGKTIYDLIPPDHIPSLKEYQNTNGFYQDVPLIPNAKELIPELTYKYDIYIVSAALEFPYSLSDRYDFIQYHFPFIDWKKIVFCGNKQIIKVDYIIDDMLDNIQNNCSKGFLFSAYHNLNIKVENRLANWEDAFSILNR